jgi:phosphoribosylglycinamide formyltransferase-1
MTPTPSLNIAVLISGNGSNLQALINAISSKQLPAKISAVISNNIDAYGIQRANQAGIPTTNLLPKDYSSRKAYDLALRDLVATYQPDLILLAGFMHILGHDFLEPFQEKILNIHPSLLPSYPGLNTHQQVLADKKSEHGCSIHYVTADLDAGPLIAQAVIEVTASDNLESIKNKVHSAEHFLYPTVVNWFAARRIRLCKEQVSLDGFILPHSGLRFIIPD